MDLAKKTLKSKDNIVKLSGDILEIYRHSGVRSSGIQTKAPIKKPLSSLSVACHLGRSLTSYAAAALSLQNLMMQARLPWWVANASKARADHTSLHRARPGLSMMMWRNQLPSLLDEGALIRSSRSII